MGEVYRARDAKLNREVAIKVLPEGLAQDPAALSRFEREAQAVAALSHPNILAIHDFGTQNGIAYAVTELLEGEVLRARLTGGSLPTRKAIDYGVHIANGIAAAHERGIVHRDLKPENIFITKTGVVKILDFGLAKAVKDESQASAGETQIADTTPGMVLGTVGYMSPEQVRAQPVDHRSDIFSFGAVFYEMLTGRRPFRGDSHIETMNAILKEDPPEFSEINANLPGAFERIIGRFTCATCSAPYHDRFKPTEIQDTCDVCGGHEFKRRPDDNEETVRTRMAEYRAKTAPILPIYESRGVVSRVDGMAEMDTVTAAIEEILGS
jgi:serine/threonine protein kinase